LIGLKTLGWRKPQPLACPQSVGTSL